jgi:hypothetical protein
MMMDALQKNTLRKLLIPLLIVLVGVIAYSSSFSGTFVYDDIPVILNNRSIRTLKVDLPYTRIVTDFSFKVNYALSGYNPADFRMVNVMIHIIASLLLYGIIRRTMLLPVFRGKYVEVADIIAGIVSALWVAHPIQTESVTYICQRYESLMGLFYLLTLYCFIRGVTAGEKSNRIWLDCSLVSAIVGMGTKEVIVTVPVVVFVYDIIFMTGSPIETLRQRTLFYLAFVGTLGIFAMLWAGTLARSFVAGTPVIPPVSSWEYLLTQSQVVVHYLKVALLLEPPCMDYGWRVVTQPFSVLPESIFLVFLLMLSIYASYRRMLAGFAGLFFFIVLAPTSSFIPVYDPAVEHRMYLPLISVIVVSVLAMHFVLKMTFNKIRLASMLQYVIYSITAGIIIVGLVITTIRRNEIYHSELTLWRDVLEKRPQNLRAHLGICSSLLKEGKLKEAEACCRNLLCYLDKLEKDMSGFQPELIKEDIRLIRVSALNNLGVCRYNNGDYGEAVLYFQQALQICERYIPARENLALSLNQLGETNRARAEFLRLLCDDPENVLGKKYLELTQNKKESHQR